jgi:hypothetical protein
MQSFDYTFLYFNPHNKTCRLIRYNFAFLILYTTWSEGTALFMFVLGTTLMSVQIQVLVQNLLNRRLDGTQSL